MRLNLNETVKFKLTERGKELYREHFSHLPDCFEQPEPRIDEDGFTEMQLWMFMEMFGEHISMWKPNVIKPLEIVFDTEDSEGCKEQKSKLESDLISRQAAIDALTGWETDPTDEEIVRTLKALPPAQMHDKHTETHGVCSDCISRQAAIDAVTKYFIDEYNKMPYEYDEEVKDNVFTDMKWVDISLEHNKEIRKVLKSLPPVEPKPVCEDCISRADTIKAMCSKCVINRECIGECSDVVAIKNMPPVEPKIYGNEHNCIMTMFGECSYSETGCGDCAVVEKVRDALKGECPPVEPKRPMGEWVDRQEGTFCSECDYKTNEYHNLCPNCGAMMKGADDE